jgi:hypothetical protein
MADDILALIATLQDEIDRHVRGDDASLIDRTHALADARARRLDATCRRLTEHLGEDHPRVLALTRRQQHLQVIADDLADVADRQRASTHPGKNEWRLHGCVTDRAGRPVVGARILLGRRGGERPVGKPATSDTRGRYSLVLDLRETPDAPEVTVEVTDAGGSRLLQSDQPLRPARGETDIADIVVRTPDIERTETRRTCEATTARGTRCRNPARPGSRFCATHGEE